MHTAVITDHLFSSVDQEAAILQSAGFHLRAVTPGCKTEDEVIERCQDADVLMVQWAPITRRVLQSLPRARYVVRYGIGVDNVDLKGAEELGVGVANVPGFCLEEVSDHALAMILSLARRIPHDHHQIAAGGWGVPCRDIPSLNEMTLGLVGFGGIARRVADKAKAFGFRIIASDPLVPIDAFTMRGVERCDLETLLKTADIVSLHCSLLRETAHMINRETIAMMKPGVLFVNTARGGLVREADLIEALESGKIAGAGLDVFEQEPLPATSPLRGMRTVVLSSHAASVSRKAVETLQRKAAEAARDFLLGKRPEGALVWSEGRTPNAKLGR